MEKFPVFFMAPEGFLIPYSQKPATGRDLEANESNPHPITPFL